MCAVDEAFHVLFVCTGNIYRSPMAEAFCRAAIHERGLHATTASASTLEGDRPIAPLALCQIEDVDPQMATHRSHLLEPEDLLGADLVIAMTREHVRRVSVLEPGAFDRTFTLKELVRRGGRVGPRRPGQTLGEWLASLGEGRTRSDLLGDSDLDDLEDPVGESPAVVRGVARQIRSAVGVLVELVSPGGTG